MKKFFYNIVVYSLICLTTLSLVTPVNAETFDNNTVESSVQNHSEFPSTIIVDGVEKKVRVVNLQEYNEDTSGDFLILINNGEAGGRSLLSENPSFKNPLLNRSWGSRILIYLGDKVVGYVVEKGIEYLVTSGVGKAVFAKVGAAAVAFWPYAAAIAVGAVAIYVVNKGVNYIVNKTINSSGCVWSGPRVGGIWLCPMRVDIEYFKEAL